MKCSLAKVFVVSAACLASGYSSIFLVNHYALDSGDKNRVKNFETLENPYREIIKDTIPTVQDWYEGLEDKDDLLQRDLLEDSSLWYPTRSNASSMENFCLETFFGALNETASHTNPDLVKLVLHGMGLSRVPVVHRHLQNILLASQPIEAIYTKSFECLSRNRALVNMACSFQDVVPNMERDFLEYLINEAVVLDRLTDAMYEDLVVVAEVVHVLLEVKEKREETYLAREGFSKAQLEFMSNKFDGIVYTLKTTMHKLAENINAADYPSVASTLQTNILEAVKLDILNGYQSNARVGLALAASVDFDPFIEDHKQMWALGEDWANAYLSWNLAFVASLPQVIPSKLLIPSVACAAHFGNGEAFIHHRTLSLAASYLLSFSTIHVSTIQDLDDEEVITRIDTVKLVNIQQGLQALHFEAADTQGWQLRKDLTQRAGDLNLKHVLLTSPTPDRVRRLLYENCGEFCHGLDQWKVSQSLPTDKLNDFDHSVFVAFILWGTVILTGFGSEVLMWIFMSQEGWNDSIEARWRLAQFLFPLLAITTLGLALFQNYMTLPMLVLGLYKFGFPETLAYMYAAVVSSRKAKRTIRISDFFDGAGNLLHHSSASLVICLLLTGVIHPTRHVVDPIIVLVIQHWFVLLKYVDEKAYFAIELILEVWFEWSIISQYETYVYTQHWTAPLAAGVMLISHWMYLLAAGIRLVVDRDDEITESITSTEDDSESIQNLKGALHERSLSTSPTSRAEEREDRADDEDDTRSLRSLTVWV